MTAGAIRFARYAYPPNSLGYCGPDDSLALFEYGSAGVVDGGLRALAQEFEGAWPYLELIASGPGFDPLDDDVVEAYWIGNALLDRVDVSSFGSSMRDRFQDRAGTSWESVADAMDAGGKPSHAFHVFCVYPWVGLMRAGMVRQPLHVLDRCRIRPGNVLEVDGDGVRVLTRPLVLDGDRLTIGPDAIESVSWASGGLGLSPDIHPGDSVALHWNWVCERLDKRSRRRLEMETAAVLRLANRSLARPRTGILA
jgi:hypothetical protein